MSLFRDLANAVRDQMELAREQAQPPIRPTSLYAAGATGEPDQQRPRSPSSPARDIAVRREGRNIYPEGAAPDDQLQQTRRRPPVAARQAPRSDSRAALLTALRSPASLRTAILVREILDPPVALRGDDSPGGGNGNPGSPNS